ncbi:MAG: Tn3 family transposase [Candidatus Competibacteraceae bacterium]|nr:Tn3 family transposase [Candidatus Competibacteraceae bacterium]
MRTPPHAAGEERPSGSAKAIIEAGRINKTVYRSTTSIDEDYRRWTELAEPRRGRDAVARAICHGHGETAAVPRKEDQLGALLVTNAVVLWNTLYRQAALDHLRRLSVDIRAEDERRLLALGAGRSMC